MIFLFYTELHILVKTIDLQNQSVFFFLNIVLDAAWLWLVPFWPLFGNKNCLFSVGPEALTEKL